MLLQIIKAEYLGNYKYKIAFNDGRQGVADLKMLAHDEPKTVFSKFSDEKFVSEGRLAHGTMLWPGDIDVAPEYIYYITFNDEQEFHNTFVNWGYCK